MHIVNWTGFCVVTCSTGGCIVLYVWTAVSRRRIRNLANFVYTSERRLDAYAIYFERDHMHVAAASAGYQWSTCVRSRMLKIQPGQTSFITVIYLLSENVGTSAFSDVINNVATFSVAAIQLCCAMGDVINSTDDVTIARRACRRRSATLLFYIAYS